jgi:hypothetical protein
MAGTTVNPNSSWMAQMARNLTDGVDGFLKGKRYLIVDRDSLFSELFKAILKSSGTKLVRTSIQAPNMNAFAERPHQGLKNALIAGGPTMSEGRVEVRDRLGGLLKYYYRPAA